jgi:Kef-type K+ transport system membrane component KefB
LENIGVLSGESMANMRAGLFTEMSTDAAILMALGAILMASLIADWVARRTILPRVSVLVLLGIGAAPLLDFLFGGSGVVRINGFAEILISIALTMVAFLLGGELTARRVREDGRSILAISLSVVLVSALFVGGGLLFFGAPPLVALLLAGISAATDPAATAAVVKASHRQTGLSRILLGVVAIDDAWGIILFGILISVADYFGGAGGGAALLFSIHELGGGILLGLGLGVPAAYLTGRLKPGQPIQAEAVGLVLLCTGLALWLQVSLLLAAMTMGAAVANLAPHHKSSFREIEHIEWPFLVFFFVFAGANLDFSVTLAVLPLAAVYIVLRIAGRIAGGWLGGSLAGLAHRDKARIGLGLTPQAGVALGMALLAADSYPVVAATVVAVTVVAPVVLEIFGPIMTVAILKD